MDRVNGRPCYCSMGAGGTPCIDRKYCDALREIERLRADRKQDCVDFFRWFWNSPGTNAEQGYDEWIKTRAALQEGSS